jgi:hypothetical protein
MILLSKLYLSSIVVTEKWVDEKGKPGTNTMTKSVEGDFEVIYDETLLQSIKKSNSRKSSLIKK